MSDPVLNQGEVTIRKEGGMEYVSWGRYSAWLYLTNQRIILQRMLGSGSAYPLSHVTKADIAEHQASTFSLMSFKLLRVNFDNGGAVLFGLHSDKNAWIQSIEQARVEAPDLPYETTPPQAPVSASRPKLAWIGIIAGISLFACTTCIIILTAFFLMRNGAS